MNKLTANISVAAMLALAALPIAALPASALAATTSVKIADLDLASAEGMTHFAKRADIAARDFCRYERDLGMAEKCRVAVKEELAEKASAVRAAQIQTAKTFAAR